MCLPLKVKFIEKKIYDKEGRQRMIETKLTLNGNKKNIKRGYAKLELVGEDRNGSGSRDELKRLVDQMIAQGRWGEPNPQINNFLAYAKNKLSGCLGDASCVNEDELNQSSTFCMVELLDTVQRVINKLNGLDQPNLEKLTKESHLNNKNDPKMRKLIN